MSVFPLAASVGKLIMMLSFQLGLAIIAHNTVMYISVGIFGLFPLLMMLFFNLRRHVHRGVRDAQQAAEMSILRHIADTVENYRMIVDYNRRPLCAEEMVDNINALNKAVTDSGAVSTNTAACPQFLFAPALSLKDRLSRPLRCQESAAALCHLLECISPSKRIPSNRVKIRSW